MSIVDGIGVVESSFYLEAVIYIGPFVISFVSMLRETRSKTGVIALGTG